MTKSHRHFSMKRPWIISKGKVSCHKSHLEKYPQPQTSGPGNFKCLFTKTSGPFHGKTPIQLHCRQGALN